MSEECVVAVYDSFAKAKDAIRSLEEGGIPSELVSLVTHGAADEALQDEAIQYGDETEHDALKGAGMGGLLGFLAASPLLTIAGLGPVLIAGPVAAGLTGAIVGGFLGAMRGWGVHTDHVERYEKKVAEGELLVIVNGDPQQVAEAKNILQQTDVDELHLHAETSADSVEP